MILIFVMQATSRLLVNYPQKQRDEILDYLFKVRNLYCKLKCAIFAYHHATLKDKKKLLQISTDHLLYKIHYHIFLQSQKCSLHA